MARILIVDDEPMNLTILGAFAKNLGHTSVHVSDALSAMLELEKARPPFDIVVTDIMMPGIDGIHLTALIKEIYPNTPVVAVTAGGEDVVKK